MFFSFLPVNNQFFHLWYTRVSYLMQFLFLLVFGDLYLHILSSVFSSFYFFFKSENTVCPSYACFEQLFIIILKFKCLWICFYSFLALFTLKWTFTVKALHKHAATEKQNKAESNLPQRRAEWSSSLQIIAPTDWVHHRAVAVPLRNLLLPFHSTAASILLALHTCAAISQKCDSSSCHILFSPKPLEQSHKDRASVRQNRRLPVCTGLGRVAFLLPDLKAEPPPQAKRQQTVPVRSVELGGGEAWVLVPVPGTVYTLSLV